MVHLALAIKADGVAQKSGSTLERSAVLDHQLERAVLEQECADEHTRAYMPR